MGFDYRGNRGSTLGGHKQKHVCINTQGKGAMTPQDTEPDVSVSVGGSPVEEGVNSGLLQR